MLIPQTKGKMQPTLLTELLTCVYIVWKRNSVKSLIATVWAGVATFPSLVGLGIY